MCNNYKKPTGAAGGIEDGINQFIKIDCRIQHSTSLGLLGASFGKDNDLQYLNSSSSCSDEASMPEDDLEPYNFIVDKEDEDKD